MDVLSDVLREVRLTGAVYFDVYAGAPWVATTPGSATICAGVMPEFDHVIGFHIVLDGRGWAQLVDSSRPAICLDAGDAVIIAGGHGHTVSSEPGRHAVPALEVYRRPTTDTLPFVLHEFGGRGEKARFVCGFLGCDAKPYNPVLEALPPLLHVRRASAAGVLTFDLMRIALEESKQPRAGGETILAKISELMFLHAVRQHIDSLPPESTGWLAALMDPRNARGRSGSVAHRVLDTILERDGDARDSVLEQVARPACRGSPRSAGHEHRADRRESRLRI